MRPWGAIATKGGHRGEGFGLNKWALFSIPHAPSLKGVCAEAKDYRLFLEIPKVKHFEISETKGDTTPGESPSIPALSPKLLLITVIRIFRWN